MRLAKVHHVLSFLLLACGIGALSCASILSPVAPVVTSGDCPKLTTCGECISNTACGWCGESCIAATSADARETAPRTCSGAWVWQVGTCPDPDAATSPAEPTKP